MYLGKQFVVPKKVPTTLGIKSSIFHILRTSIYLVDLAHFESNLTFVWENELHKLIFVMLSSLESREKFYTTQLPKVRDLCIVTIWTRMEC